MSNENEYPQRIRGLLEDLRILKEKHLDLQEKFRKEARGANLNFEQMMKLEEKCKEYRNMLSLKRGESISNDQQSKPYHLVVQEEKIDELTKVNGILA
jgi:hypothetical protein